MQKLLADMDEVMDDVESLSSESDEEPSPGGADGEAKEGGPGGSGDADGGGRGAQAKAGTSAAARLTSGAQQSAVENAAAASADKATITKAVKVEAPAAAGGGVIKAQKRPAGTKRAAHGDGDVVDELEAIAAVIAGAASKGAAPRGSSQPAAGQILKEEPEEDVADLAQAVRPGLLLSGKVKGDKRSKQNHNS